MKKLIILAIVSATFFNAQAQGPGKGFKVGGGLSVVVPANNLKGYSVGVGFDLLGQYGLSSQLALTGDVGYTTIFAKNKDAKALNVIPIRGGIRFYPVDMFYLGAKAGVGILTGGGNSQSGLAYSFGAGFKLDEKLDLGLSYDGNSLKSGSIKTSFGYVGLRLGYFFN